MAVYVRGGKEARKREGKEVGDLKGVSGFGRADIGPSTKEAE